MEKTKYTLTLLSLFCFISLGYAANSDSVCSRKWLDSSQYTVSLSAANFTIAGLTKFYPDLGPFSDNIANQFGLSVERRMRKRLYAGVAFAAWNTMRYLDRNYTAAWNYQDPVSDDHYGDFRYPVAQPHYDEIGAWRFRHAYKMIDLNALYAYDHFKRHRFTGGLGLSFTWGTNIYLDRILYNPVNNIDLYYFHRETHGYAGVILPFRYDLLFLRGKLATGLQGNVRKYFGIYSVQIDYGVHLNINL